MHRPTESRSRSGAAAAVLLLALLAAGAGCRPEEEAPRGYERLTGQILTDALAAIHQRDHDLAVAKLEQLRALNPATEFVNQLILQEKTEVAIAEVNERLAKDEPGQARARLAQALVDIGRTPRLRHAQEQLTALEVISAYHGAATAKVADDAVAALAKLPAPELLDNSASYTAWLAAERQQVEALRTAERLHLGGEVLDELDLALVTNDQRVPVLLAELQALDPNQPVLASEHDAPVTLAKVDGLAVDLICFRQALGLDAERRTAVLKFYAGRQPYSLCGRYLAAWADLAGDKPVTALAGLRDLLELVPDLDLTPLRPELRRRLRQAAPDRAPTVPDVLEQLYRLQAEEK